MEPLHGPAGANEADGTGEADEANGVKPKRPMTPMEPMSPMDRPMDQVRHNAKYPSSESGAWRQR